MNILVCRCIITLSHCVPTDACLFIYCFLLRNSNCVPFHDHDDSVWRIVRLTSQPTNSLIENDYHFSNHKNNELIENNIAWDRVSAIRLTYTPCMCECGRGKHLVATTKTNLLFYFILFFWMNIPSLSDKVFRIHIHIWHIASCNHNQNDRELKYYNKFKYFSLPDDSSKSILL